MIAFEELTEEKQEMVLALKMAMRGDELKDSFYKFVLEFWEEICKEPLVNNFHIEKLCHIIQDNIDRVIRREPKLHDVIINIPPGSTKSILFSIMANAWAWSKAPWLIFITGSHDINLSLEFSVKTRDILKSEKFNNFFPGVVTIRQDKDQKGCFENTAGGIRKACSVGSNITGWHAHIKMIDDALNPKGARSEAEIKEVNEWMAALASRNKDRKVTITFLIMQRLAENDPTGVWLEMAKNDSKPIYHVCLPGEIRSLDNVKPKKWKKYYKNDLMDPNRRDWEDIKDDKIILGRRGYAAQILQNPSAIEGNYFKREWWQYYKELSQVRSVTYQSWDTAFKTGEEHDFSVCTTWNIYPNGFYLVHLWKDKVESPELKNQIKIMAEDFKPHKVLIEDKASGITTIQELKRESNINIVPITPIKDKITRANDAIPTIEAGNVYLPENASWTADLIDNCAAFPDAKHDDIPDSITQFLNYIRLNNSSGGYHSARRSADIRGY